MHLSGPLLILSRFPVTGAANSWLQWENRILWFHILVNSVPVLGQRLGCLPCQFGVTQPKTNEMASISVLLLAEIRDMKRQNFITPISITHFFSAESRNFSRAWKMLKLLAN